MKLNPIAVIIVICLFTNTNAQMFPTDSVALAEMKKLQFMASMWTGSGG